VFYGGAPHGACRTHGEAQLEAAAVLKAAEGAVATDAAALHTPTAGVERAPVAARQIRPAQRRQG
jgi:hypothetical protein